MIVFKSAKNCIITLKLFQNSKTNINRPNVVNKNYAKFRTDQAFVVNIKFKISIEGEKNPETISSDYDHLFIYRIGEIVKVNDYDENDYTSGIHFYLTEEAAFYGNFFPENGLMKKWYDNGQIAEEGTYYNNKKEGKWIEWYENGQIFKEGKYKNGERIGKWIIWYFNGQIMFLRKY